MSKERQRYRQIGTVLLAFAVLVTLTTGVAAG